MPIKHRTKRTGRKAAALSAVTIYLWGDKLDPEKVTKRLGVRPTDSRVRGQARVGPKGRTTKARTGVWEFCAVQSPLAVTDVSDQILLLRSAFRGNISRYLAGLNVQNACIDAYMAAPQTFEEYVFPFELKASAVKAAKEMGLPIRFTIAWPIPEAELRRLRRKDAIAERRMKK